MTIIGIDGPQVIIRMNMWEYRKVAKTFAKLDDDDPEKE